MRKLAEPQSALGDGIVLHYKFWSGITSIRPPYSLAVIGYADHSSTVTGAVRVLAGNHGFNTGQWVEIANTTNYDGVYQITKIDSNNFYIITPWVANDGASIAGRADTIADYSTNDFYGAVKGVNTLSAEYPGFRFDGSGDWIQISDDMLPLFKDSFSVAMWVKPDDGHPTTNGDYLFGVDDGIDSASSENQVGLQLEADGTLSFRYRANGVANEVFAQTASAQFMNGPKPFWTHVAFIANNEPGIKQFYIVVDGTAVNLDAGGDGSIGSVDMSAFTSQNDPIFYAPRIGAKNKLNGTAVKVWDGLIDDVIIWNRALSAEEVKSLYQRTRWRYGK